MSKAIDRKIGLLYPSLLAGFIASLTIAGSGFADEVGYDALVARLSGQAIPNGAGIRIGQVEASVDAGNPLVYGPDQTLAEFSGKTFLAQSGVPAVSWHANTVGQLMYSNTQSMATGVTQIYLWEVNSFISSTLRYGQGSAAAPLTPPSTALKIYNHSWIGGFSGSIPTAGDIEVLRRADFAMNRDDTLYVVGMNNGATAATYPMMAMGYHGLSVGRMDGDHSHGDVPVGGDGPGRMKPEIVAPNTATSWSTPVVSSAAALLFQTAATYPGLLLNTNADETTVIKAVLMAGARHRVGWTNNPATSGLSRGVTTKPLDAVYGVDVVNIDRSHLILTGLEKDGASTAAAATLAPVAGWDFEVLPSGAARYWRFRTTQTIDQLSVVATWNRSQTNAIIVPTVADINLTLLRVGAGGVLESLEGDAAAVNYASGNVASRSLVDNTEHLFVRGLVAGEYVIEAKRIGSVTTSATFAIAWILPTTPPGLPGDLNNDGYVNGLDLTVILSNWNGTGAGDINNDGVVNGLDLTVVLSGWTP